MSIDVSSLSFELDTLKSLAISDGYTADEFYNWFKSEVVNALMNHVCKQNLEVTSTNEVNTATFLIKKVCEKYHYDFMPAIAFNSYLRELGFLEKNADHIDVLTSTGLEYGCELRVSPNKSEHKVYFYEYKFEALYRIVLDYAKIKGGK